MFLFGLVSFYAPRPQCLYTGTAGNIFSILSVLDEASSALDVETENKFYELCASFGITLISVGHRESLQQVRT